MEFFTHRRKVTTKWARPAAGHVDAANFDGKM